MIPFNLLDVVSFLNAELVNSDQRIYSISIDSRSIGNNCLFIALKGKRFDGHNFVLSAINSGAIGILVDHFLPYNITQLVVSDTIWALGQLGLWNRNRAKSRVIAITGSMGKTSTKEMVASILRNCGKVISTYKNFNNYIGVALTLLRLTEQDDFAVIELGASTYGEIARSIDLVIPEIVLINNISYTHLSNFGSLFGVSKAKGEVFTKLQANSKVLLNADSHNWFLWKHILSDVAVYWFSSRSINRCNFFVSKVTKYSYGIRFILHTPYGICPILLKLLGYHNVINALAAGALATLLHISLRNICQGLEALCPLPGRLFPILLKRNKLLLDDSYNSSICSVFSAIKVIIDMPGYLVLVLTDMVELDIYSEIKFHCYLGRVVRSTNINEVITFGSVSYIISCAANFGKHFVNHYILVDYLLKLLYEHEEITILIKGSRIFAMDDIIKILLEQYIC